VFSFKPSHVSHRLSPARVVLAGLLALAGLANFAAAASAEPACKGETVSQPFLKWSDHNYYALAPGGDFEKGMTGWSLSGAAKVVSGSETYAATGALGKYSLELPAGATAQTPYMCVEANYPTFRFFDKNGGSASTLAVEVLYKNTLLSGGALSGTTSPGANWGPSPEMQTLVLVGGVLSGGATAQLSLRFKATAGTSRIDDVLVDPRMH
jgi:hypothetical protein